jgi:hypothetical protein
LAEELQLFVPDEYDEVLQVNPRLTTMGAGDPMVPPMRASCAMTVLAEKYPSRWAFPVVDPVAELAVMISVDRLYAIWLSLMIRVLKVS